MEIISSTNKTHFGFDGCLNLRLKNLMYRVFFLILDLIQISNNTEEKKNIF